jgi:uncharacterized membrane protein
MEEIGPVDYAVIAFPGSRFNGEIAPALADLVEAGTIRLIDAAFVSKDDEGKVSAFEITELADDVQEALAALNIDVQGLLNDEELLAAGEGLEPGSSAALLVWENVWARRIAQSMREAGGVLVGFERVPHQVVQAAREFVLEEAQA